MAEWIGIGRRARRCYGFDEVALVPGIKVACHAVPVFIREQLAQHGIGEDVLKSLNHVFARFRDHRVHDLPFPGPGHHVETVCPIGCARRGGRP